VDAGALITSLDRFGRVLPALVADLPTDDAGWRPDDDAWSIADVVQHLADEEVLDFRPRLQSTLANPAADWTPIDPEGTARTARARGVDMRAALERFVQERGDSVAWLRSVGDVDWSTAHVHPKFGAMRAGDLLGAWADHDALHLRQIAKRMHQLAVTRAAPFTTVYAGDWSA